MSDSLPSLSDSIWRMSDATDVHAFVLFDRFENANQPTVALLV